MPNTHHKTPWAANPTHSTFACDDLAGGGHQAGRQVRQVERHGYGSTAKNTVTEMAT